MTDDGVGLLKEEYFHLHNAVQEFDQRALTIKAWSVTTSMVGIAVSFYEKIPVLLLLSSLSSLLFWVIEACWKEFQQCYYPRIMEIENFFRHPDRHMTESPLQIHRSWSQTYNRFNISRFLKIMCWPHVRLPHFIIVVGGFVIWKWGIQWGFG
jgi:hypothetical protein